MSEPQPHAHWALISYAIGMGILSCLSLAVGPGAASPQLVVFAAAVALACWGLTLTGLRIDPLALFRTYIVSDNLVAAAVGLAAGAAGAWTFFQTDQRHLSTLPLVWLTLLTGFGTGIAILWGLAVEWRRRALDRRVVAIQSASHAEIRQRVKERMEAVRTRESLMTQGNSLDTLARAASGFQTQLDAARRNQVPALLLVASEICRALGRVLEVRTFRLAPRVHQVMDSAKSVAGAETRLTAAEFDQIRSSVAILGARCLAEAGAPTRGPDLAAGLSLESTTGTSTVIAYVRSARNPVSRWLSRGLGLVSVAGPRPGAFYGVALLLIALLILGLFELPANGVAPDVVASWLGGPVLILWMLWLWLSLQQKASIFSLLGQLTVALLAVGLVVGWWHLASKTWPGVRAPSWASTAVLLAGALPGWTVATWRVRRQHPYPQRRIVTRSPEQILESTSMGGLTPLAERWRGELIAQAWTRFFDGPIVGWLNGPISETLAQTAPGQTGKIGNLLLRLRDEARASASPGVLVRAAVATATLQDLARWQLACQALGELMGDDELDRCQSDLQRLAETQDQTVDDWLATFGAAATPDDWSIERLARRNVFPPRIQGFE